MINQLGPADEARERERLSKKLGVPSGDIGQMWVCNWLTGEIRARVAGRGVVTEFMQPAIERGKS